MGPRRLPAPLRPPPEGIWLPETAVDERVLAVVAEEGLRFTILAPGQLRAIRALDGGPAWQDVTGDGAEPVRTDRAYRWCHPGRPDVGLDLVVYDGGLAHGAAFGDPSSEAIVRWAHDHVPDGNGGGGACVAAAALAPPRPP